MRTDFFFLQNLRNEEQVAIIQASTVLSLAEKVSPYQCIELGELLEKKNVSLMPCCFAVCRPLVDPADRRDRSGTAPEDDRLGDRDGKSM